jgi:hypothetical protein
MKTQALNWQADISTVLPTTLESRLDSGSVLQVVLLILAATLPVALVSVITLWAISTGSAMYVSAMYWSVGFIFLALMVENENGHRTILAGSGISMMLLAWMSSRITPEFGVLAGFLLAAWLAAPFIRCLTLRAAG